MAPPNSLSGLIDRWQEAEPAALQRICNDYFPRLRALSRRTLGALPGANVEADDVLQSAFKSLCRFMRARDRSTRQNRDDLWRLLCCLVVRKSRRRVLRQTRGLKGGRLRPLTDLAPEGDAALEHLLPTVTPAEFDDGVEECLSRLPPILQQIALLTMEGCTQAEIAERLSCSRRTVIRKFELLRASLQELRD